MTMVYRKLPLAACLILLAGCSSSPSQPKLHQLHNQVGKLNQEMRQLTTQASALEQQGLLNSGSAQGAWLLPQAKTAVILKSQAGDLTLSLSDVKAGVNSTRVTVNIGAASNALLPAFSARVEWGELDHATGKPLVISSQSQKIEVAGSSSAGGTVQIPLQLGNFSPARLGYVRIHDVLVISARTPAAASTCSGPCSTGQ